jgi:hypothetical protein
VLTVLTAELSPTTTHKIRSIAWVSDGSGEVVVERTGEVIPAAGKLTTKLQFGRRAGGKVEVDTYAVSEVAPDRPGERKFLLLNLTDPDPNGPFPVVIGPQPRCGCEAGGYRVATCKHRDALASLIEEGVDFGYAPQLEAA